MEIMDNNRLLCLMSMLVLVCAIIVVWGREGRAVLHLATPGLPFLSADWSRFERYFSGSVEWAQPWALLRSVSKGTCSPPAAPFQPKNPNTPYRKECWGYRCKQFQADSISLLVASPDKQQRSVLRPVHCASPARYWFAGTFLRSAV